MHKFYKHFKGNPYRLIGTAKFSESLEEMIVYEALYKNPEGPLWVRPKSMFEEVIERDGNKVPRFRPIPLDIGITTGIPRDSVVSDILVVVNKVLRPMNSEDFLSKIRDQKNLLVLTCRIDQNIVGFKVGYEKDQATFYSWLGGVDPQYQRLGVASALMRAMEDWCRLNSYCTLETKTTNDNKAMIVLNTLSGFDIIDVKLDAKGIRKILMSKMI
jgi:GNAT superfamily N-acetyltransferase